MRTESSKAAGSLPQAGTQTVRRAVKLLKAFTDDHPEWGLSELARSAGLNKTTTYRLLTALELEGMVARNAASDGYRLGPAALALSGRALRANGLREAAHAELRALADATGETATLEVLVDGQVLILDEAFGPHVLGTSQSVGTRWPAHATSTGKVLLAYLPEAPRQALLASGLAPLTARTITGAAELERELEQARRQGYATAADELEAGFVAIGAPVRNFAGEVVAAVSIGGPSVRLPRARWPEMVRQVTAAAARISARLGY